MIVGTPKEIKNNENRVGLTPGGAKELVKRGHVVYIEKGAGINSGFEDEEYITAGAQILETAKEIYSKSEMIVKVKEPIESEYDLIHENQIVFTYFHFASNKALTDAMVKSGAVCIAYETVELPDRSLPLLIPMSEVAGRMSVQEGAHYLQKSKGGKGILISGVPGVAPARILILGAGIVGLNAATVAAGFGADVTIMDISLPRLRYLSEILPKNVRTIYSSEYNIRKALPETDVVIGAVLKPGAKAPHLITRDMVPLLKKGSVMVDVAIDQGGCFETSRPTSHDEPIYSVDGVTHYCVANIPGAVAFTSTLALTNATLPYIIALAGKGWEMACHDDAALAKGLNIIDGKIVYKAVADAFA